MAYPAGHQPDVEPPASGARQLPGSGAFGCPSSYLEWDATAPVRDAVAAGKNTVTLVLRIAENRQEKPAFGRTYATDPGLAVVYNTPPDTPTNLRVGSAQHPCTTPNLFIGDDPVTVIGDVSDPDGSYQLSARVAFWAVDDPADRREVVTSHTQASRPSSRRTCCGTGKPTRGRPAAKTVTGRCRRGARPAGSRSTGPGRTRRRPSSRPTTRRTAGRPGSGGDGLPGEFTFTANGVPDVAGFEWSGVGVQPGAVDADQLGGSATASIAPTADGPCDIVVSSVDRAGNRSDQRTYRFWVRATAPSVSVVAGQVGAPVTATFTAVQDEAATFTYQVDDGSESSVPVGADGTAGVELAVPPGEPYFHSVTVWTVNAAGQRSGKTTEYFEIDAARPEVEVSPGQVLLGESTEITFRPVMADVASYTYWIDSGERVVVPAAADGTARVDHTWTEGGYHDIVAFSTNAAGADSGVSSGTVFVDAGAPEITSEDYPRSDYGGGPGIAGTFHFSSPLSGVTESGTPCGGRRRDGRGRSRRHRRRRADAGRVVAQPARRVRGGRGTGLNSGVGLVQLLRDRVGARSSPARRAGAHRRGQSSCHLTANCPARPVRLPSFTGDHACAQPSTASHPSPSRRTTSAGAGRASFVFSRSAADGSPRPDLGPPTQSRTGPCSGAVPRRQHRPGSLRGRESGSSVGGGATSVPGELGLSVGEVPGDHAVVAQAHDGQRPWRRRFVRVGEHLIGPDGLAILSHVIGTISFVSVAPWIMLGVESGASIDAGRSCATEGPCVSCVEP